MFEALDLKIASEKTEPVGGAHFSGGYWCPTAYLCFPSHVGCTAGCPQ